jgi:hypothetical protein
MMSVASQMGACSASSQLGGSRITIAMVTAACAPPAACVPCVFDAARKEFLYWTPPAEQPRYSSLLHFAHPLTFLFLCETDDDVNTTLCHFSNIKKRTGKWSEESTTEHSGWIVYQSSGNEIMTVSPTDTFKLIRFWTVIRR